MYSVSQLWSWFHFPVPHNYLLRLATIVGRSMKLIFSKYFYSKSFHFHVLFSIQRMQNSSEIRFVSFCGRWPNGSLFISTGLRTELHHMALNNEKKRFQLISCNISVDIQKSFFSHLRQKGASECVP